MPEFVRQSEWWSGVFIFGNSGYHCRIWLKYVAQCECPHMNQ